jgi:hypothetical protein
MTKIAIGQLLVRVKTKEEKQDHFKLELLLQGVGTACLDLSTVFAAPNSYSLPLHCKLPHRSKII